jgi:hypothetical protein
MRPLQRPSKQMIDTIEYNLEQLDDLTVEELEVFEKNNRYPYRTRGTIETHAIQGCEVDRYDTRHHNERM